MFDWLMEPINFVINWFQVTIYDYSVEAFAYMVKQMTLASIGFMVWAIGFAWEVAEQIIQDLGVTDALNSAWSTIPGDTVSVLTFFQIPQMVSILVTAFITAYVMKFIPMTGK